MLLVPVNVRIEAEKAKCVFRGCDGIEGDGSLPSIVSEALFSCTICVITFQVDFPTLYSATTEARSGPGRSDLTDEASSCSAVSKCQTSTSPTYHRQQAFLSKFGLVIQASNLPGMSWKITKPPPRPGETSSRLARVNQLDSIMAW